jgi:hypothetical protein
MSTAEIAALIGVVVFLVVTAFFVLYRVKVKVEERKLSAFRGFILAVTAGVISGLIANALPGMIHAVDGVVSPGRSSSPPPSSSSAPTQRLQSDKVRFHGPLTLTPLTGASGTLVHLDDLPYPSQRSPGDIYYDADNSAIRNQVSNSNTLALWKQSRAPSRTECATEIGTSPRNSVPADLGTGFCVETVQGRFAFGRILSSTRQEARLDVVVWDNPI